MTYYAMAGDPHPDVRVGDIWEDCDPRSKGRELHITAVSAGNVWADVPGSPREACIRRDRMRPTANGYRLVERDGKPIPTSATEGAPPCPTT